MPTWQPQLDTDVGEPQAACREGPAGVFSRAYTRGVAALDCNTWTAELNFTYG